MNKRTEKLSKETIKGFFPFLLTNLVPLVTLVVFGIFSSHAISDLNATIIENDKEQIMSRVTEVFSEAKGFDTQLNQLISNRYFPHTGNLKSNYWSAKEYNALQEFFESYNDQREYVDKCFIYLPENNSIISQRGVQSTDMYYSSEFSKNQLTKELFNDILSTSVTEGSFVNSYDDSPYCFYILPCKAANLNTLVCYVIDKKNFYPDTLSDTYTDKVNIYIFNINDKLVLNANSYRAQSLTSLNDFAELNSDYIYSEDAQFFSAPHTMVITFRKTVWLYIPLIFMFALIIALIANIIFSIINLRNLANNNYKPLINIERMLNQGQLKHEYSLIEEAIRSLITNNESLKNEISTQRTSTINYLLLQLISSGLPKDMKFILEQYGISFDYKNFVVITFLLDKFPDNSLNEERFYSEFTENIKNTLDESKLYYILDGDRIILIVNTNDEDYELLQKAHVRIVNLLNTIKSHIYFNVHVGFSSIHTSYLQLDMAYMESLQAISYDYPLQGSQVHMYDNIRNNSEYLNTKFEKALLEHIKGRNEEKVISTLDDFFSQLEYTPSKKQNELFYKLSCVLIQVPALLGLSEKETAEFTKAISQLELTTDTATFKQHITDILSRLLRKTSPGNHDTSNNVMSAALEYTQQHYDDFGLSLTMVASYFGYTPNYFASMFKKEFGINWNGFLNEFRIEQAKKLILDGLSVNECYQSCGFTNLRTFNRMFKKIVGCTATEFRQSSKAKSIKNVDE